MIKECPMRHKNGNCLPAGGFCTAVRKITCEALQNAYQMGYMDMGNRAKAEDIVKVVRCKDCKYRAKGLPYCAYFGKTDFCSKGERKEIE